MFFSLPAKAATSSLLLPPPDPTQEYQHRIWNREQGLPDNEVRAVLQTHDGYLWAATRVGLARFDGRSFTVFNHVNTPAMTDDDCLELMEDRAGTLYVSTYDGGLLAIHASGVTRHDPATGWPGRNGGRIYANRSEGLWVGQGQLFQLFRGEYKLCVTSVSDPDHISCLHEDASGKVWIGTMHALDIYSSQTGRVHLPNLPPALTNSIIRAIQSDSTGAVWVATDTSLCRFRLNQWECFGAPDTVNNGRRVFMLIDSHDDVWLPAGVRGVLRIRQDRWTYFEVPRSQAKQETNYAQYMCQDREGNLWIATQYDGLQCWQPRKIRTLSKQNGLADENVLAVCAAHDGTIWVGTQSNVSQFKDDNFNLHLRDEQRRHITGSLAEDSVGNLWLGTLGAGVDCFQEGKFKNIRLPGERSGNKVHAQYFARDGTHWIGTEAGLCEFKGGAFRVYTHADGLSAHVDGLEHDDVRALQEDRDGNLWIGTFGGGVSCLQATTNANRPRLVTYSRENGLAGNYVWTLHEDAKGILWIGTNRGLTSWRSGRFHSFTLANGLPANSIYQIVEDDFGCFWFGCERGIFRTRASELEAVADERSHSIRCVLYDESDGLFTSGINGEKSQPVGCKTRDGRLWFATAKGIAVIDPHDLPDNRVPPPVVIEQVRANGSIFFDNGLHTSDKLSPYGNASALNRPAALHFRFPPGSAHILEIQYTANSFVANEKVRFKYRLEGLDKDWIDAGGSRKAYYANLKPGDYRFRVTAANSHGLWNETGAVFSFRLLPHFYETWTFYSLSGVTLALGIYGIYRWRVTELRRIEHLEKEAALKDERSRIVRDLHDGLGANLTQISLLADVAHQMPPKPEEMPDHFRQLSRTSHEALHSLKHIIWAAHPANETLDRLILRICQHAENFLEAAGVRCRFDLPEDLPALPLPVATRQNFFFVVREALNNIARHANATEVQIKAALDDTRLIFTIVDNGCGFDTGAVPDALEDSSPKLGGHGLRNMRHRLATIHGELQIESTPGQGTKTTLRIPVHPK
ncbi:MAG: ATP-binding protein [Verrucomicrobia bacterium]|nr:ATP-binding protein [Verrucomicrobiota bacterium]